MSPRARRPKAIDWAAVRKRLDDVAAATSTAALSVEQTRAILDERARLLSRPHIEASPSTGSRDVLFFAVGGERFVVETTYVREIVRLVDFTPVPGAPDFVVGVSNYRGQILCVVSLRSILGAPSSLTDLSRIVVMGLETAEFGILADRTEAISVLRASEVLPLSESVTGTGRGYLLGVTREAVLVLDGRQLLHDSRLFVDQREAAMPASESFQGDRHGKWTSE
jgi:purine-binding chemotaxis protein CheW